MRIPSAAGLRLDVGKARAGRWIGNADEVIAGGTLDLATGELRFALQRLVTVRTIELEFVGIHMAFAGFRQIMRKSGAKSI
jgi:hypothetical protein